MITFDEVRSIALALPEVAEGISYGTPSFNVRGKFLGRLLEDGARVTIYIEPEERQHWHAADPATFTVPEHYKKYNYMVVALNSVTKNDMRTLIENAWRLRAPSVLVRAAD